MDIEWNGGECMDKQDVNRLFEQLPKDKQQQVEAILADRQKTQQLLNSPQAQDLMRKLMGGR